MDINVSARFGLVIAAISFVLIDGSFWVLRILGGGFGLHRRWCLVDASCVRRFGFDVFGAVVSYRFRSSAPRSGRNMPSSVSLRNKGSMIE